MIRNGKRIYYPLPITHYPLPITNYPLPITNYPLPITHYPLPNSARQHNDGKAFEFA
ncbi:MAG: hypothetical protein ACKPFI_00715 [Dolichospermum sp.]